MRKAAVLAMAAFTLPTPASAGVRVSRTWVKIAEGAHDTVFVDLAPPARNTEDVVVRFASDDPSWVVVEPAEVVFEAQRGHKQHVLNITVADDDHEHPTRQVRIRAVSVTSGDLYYENWDTSYFELTVVVGETDVADMTFSDIEAITHENGTLDGGFLLSLTQAPTADVSVEITVAPASAATASPFHFWLTADTLDRRIVVRATDNDVDEGDRDYRVIVTLKQNAGNDKHDPFNDHEQAVVFTVIDDDTSGIAVVENEEGKVLETSEADTGGPTMFQVRLTSRPTEPVTVHCEVSADGSGEGLIWNPELVFFPTDSWWAPQVAGVQALDDGGPEAPRYAAYDGDKNYTVAIRTNSEDPNYKGLSTTVRVTNRDNDGFDKLRLVVRNTRGGIEDPNYDQGSHEDLELSELRFRDPSGLPIDLSGASAGCFQTFDVTEPCPQHRDCGSGCDAPRVIDADVQSDWRTKGLVTLEITFDTPKTICEHALVWGHGAVYANPYRWDVLGWWEGDGGEWTRVYSHADDIVESGPEEQTPWFDICRSRYGSLRRLGAVTDPPPPTPQPPPTPEPTTAAPPTPAPTSAASDTGREEDDDDAGTLFTWIVVLVGLMIAIGGLLLLYYNAKKAKRRAPPKPPTPEPSLGEDRRVFMEVCSSPGGAALPPPQPLLPAPPAAPHTPLQKRSHPPWITESAFGGGSFNGSCAGSALSASHSMMGGVLGSRSPMSQTFRLPPPSATIAAPLGNPAVGAPRRGRLGRTTGSLWDTRPRPL